VDITIYLPDLIGEQAKEAKLPLSRMLRAAVELELERRATMARTLKQTGTATYLLDVEGVQEGHPPYTARLVGAELVRDGKPGSSHRAFLTDDGRVFVYVEEHGSLINVADDPVEKLREWLRDDAYLEALVALGIKPVVDV
jgi:hypothetical protein